MQALEFELDISSDIFEIPENIKNRLLGKHVKFIAIYDDDNEKIKSKVNPILDETIKRK